MTVAPDRLERALATHVLTAVAPPHPAPDRGPLRGVTATVKDVWDVAGTPTRAGTRFLPDTPAERDAPLVARLRERGARVLGTTATTELAFSVLGENDAVAAPGNPHDPDRVCGGSSSGAGAAVATGVGDLALGTDSGGSVRLPAAWCGAVGVKPTLGVVGSGGALPGSASLDAVGVLAATVTAARAGVAALTDDDALAGDLLRPPDRAPVLAELATPQDWTPDPHVAVVVAGALDHLRRAGLLAVTGRGVDAVTACHAVRARLGTSLAAMENARTWAATVRDAGDAASPRLREWARRAEPVQPDVVARLHAERARLVSSFAAHTPPGTVWVLPASPTVPPSFAELGDPAAYRRLYARAHALLWPFNELDAPAVCLPCGRTPAGLPVALQLVAPRGRDRDVLDAALAVEAVLEAG